MSEDSSQGFYNVHQYLGKMVARMLCSLTLTEVEVFGEANIEKLPRPYILVMNHCSHWDPVCVWAYYPDLLNFMVKEELHKIPSFGAMSQMAGNISIKREGADVGAVKDAIKLVKQGYNLCVFAEGTRSFDGKVQPFKEGAVSLATRLRVPIVPAYIHGTHNVLPRNGRFIRAHRSQIHILSPVMDCVDSKLSKSESELLNNDLYKIIKGKQDSLV